MNFNKIVQDYFLFTKRERIAILFFGGLLLLILVYRISLNFYINPILKIDIKNIQLPNDTFIYCQIEESTHPFKTTPTAKLINPNTASFNELIAIGFTNKQASIIYNYRKKGGIFKFKDDLLKIYGVDSVNFDKIKKYVELPIKELSVESTKIIGKKKDVIRLDLNEADSISLLTVNGIGPYLAHQIILFRDKSGGFLNLEQLQQIKGMHENNFIQLETSLYIGKPAKKIDINTVDLKKLALHPYSNWQLAKLIINYRNQHGSFNSINDLEKIFGMEKTILSKILPYLTVE